MLFNSNISNETRCDFLQILNPTSILVYHSIILIKGFPYNKHQVRNAFSSSYLSWIKIVDYRSMTTVRWKCLLYGHIFRVTSYVNQICHILNQNFNQIKPKPLNKSEDVEIKFCEKSFTSNFFIGYSVKLTFSFFSSIWELFSDSTLVIGAQVCIFCKYYQRSFKEIEAYNFL